MLLVIFPLATEHPGQRQSLIVIEMRSKEGTWFTRLEILLIEIDQLETSILIDGFDLQHFFLDCTFLLTSIYLFPFPLPLFLFFFLFLGDRLSIAAFLLPCYFEHLCQIFLHLFIIRIISHLLLPAQLSFSLGLLTVLFCGGER